MKFIAKNLCSGYKHSESLVTHLRHGEELMMYKGLIIAGVILSQLGSSPAHASAIPAHLQELSQTEAFHTVDKVEVRIKSIEEKPVIQFEDFAPGAPTPPIGGGPGPIGVGTPNTTAPNAQNPGGGVPFPQLPIPGMGQPGQTGPLQILDLAIKFWNIVKDGAPVVNLRNKSASALPMISSGRWESLAGWKGERSITYGVTVTNLYGMETVNLEYTVSMIYGGNVNGIGKYISSARVIPRKVDVLWGFNLDVNVDIPNIYNVATPENPLAAITIDVNYKVSTILRSTAYTKSFEVRGDGMIKSGNKVLIEANPEFKAR
jgi:hypothetical protein